MSRQAELGIGGYLLIQNFEQSLDSGSENIRLTRFEGASSSELELRTLLWALSERGSESRKLTVVTDSQNIVGLAERRNRLERTNFRNGKGERLRLADHYRQFFRFFDEYAFDVFKVKGHTRKSEQSKIERLFSFLDRSVRKELRGRMKE